MAASLKAKNAWIINAAIAAQFLVFVWVVLRAPPLIAIDDKNIIERAQSAIAPGAVSLALIVIVGLILRGMLPGTLRDRLVHLRWRHPLPGCRAFSHIGPKDARVDMDKLAAKYGPFPANVGEQNPKFYSIYKEYRDEAGVLDAHRSYLLARDLAVVCWFCTITLPVAALFVTGALGLCVLYGGALLLLSLLLCFAAKSYGRRMVENTLALASH